MRGIEKKIVFIDTEFTGEHAYTTLVALGLVTLDGQELYLAFNDYDPSQVTDWLRKNVLSKIDPDRSISGRQGYLELQKFLESYSGGEKVFVVSAGLAQDITLFLEIFKHKSEEAVQFHALHDLPDYLHHFAFIDLNTLFRCTGVPPMVDREAYVGRATASTERHNALEDAKIVRECFLKLVSTPAGRKLISTL